MSWWGFKALQGLFWGGMPFLLGAVIVILAAATDQGRCLMAAGLAIVLAGLGGLLYYAAAPLTCRWLVYVPPNRCWAVEDLDGQTVEFLGPGWLHVPWRMNTQIVEFVNFQVVTVATTIEDVLQTRWPVVDLEVSVVMEFNPVEADPDSYERLRVSLNTVEKLESLVIREFHGSIRRYLSRLPRPTLIHLLGQPADMEAVLAGQLQSLARVGLLLGSADPVSIYVRGTLPDAPPPAVPEPAPPPDPVPTVPSPARPRGRRAQPLPRQGFDPIERRYEQRRRPPEDR